MRNKSCIFIFSILYLFWPFSLCEANDSKIIEVNDAVKRIESNKDRYKIVEVKLHTDEFEGVPPQMYFYYEKESGKPQLFEVSVGHEVFTTRFNYFFRNGKVIKYLKSYDGHPEKPPKEAIIYDEKGGILWQNTDSPVISTKDIESLFDDIWKSLNAFSKY